MQWMAIPSGNFSYHHHVGRGSASSPTLQSLDTVLRRPSAIRFNPEVGRMLHTAQSVLRTAGPLFGLTMSAVHSQGRWHLDPPFCRSSASEAAGSLPLAVENAPTQGPQGGGNVGTSAEGTQPTPSGLAGAPQSGDQTVQSNLRLLVAAFMIPHPDKVDRGGEDAYFVGEDGLSLGVADGVGGWADMGIDPGDYARLLMSNCKESAKRTPPSSSAPVGILSDAHYRTNVPGSATACVIVLDRENLQAANLGDSGFLVVRGSQVVFRSPPQQHDFNFPFQLGAPGSQSDKPEDAEVFTVQVQANDIVVLGSDGLFDNVFPEESAAITSLIHGRGDPPQVAAAGLAQFASIRANDPQHTSPFAYVAQSMGHKYNGGKLDDITVLVAYVTPASTL
eukprot:jgi/Botrbrau1/1139/Bobra.0162s0030.1